MALQHIRRVTLALILLILLASPGAAARAQEPTHDVRVTQVDTSDYPDVTVYVAVDDATGGAAVGGLRQHDFAITEDGTPVEIVNVQGGGSVPINTALVLDRSGSMDDDGKMEGARQAARTFVGQMRPDDKTTLIVFDEQAQVVQRLSNDTDTLHSTLDSIWSGGGTALYDSLVQGVDALEGVSGRRVLLVLTDGQDCREPSMFCGGFAGSRHTLREAIAYANKHDQPVYVVGLGARDSDGIDETVLQQIASETHGEYFYAPGADDLVGLYGRLSASLHQEYALTYHSPRPFYDGTRRDIVVQVGAVSSAGGYTEQHSINVHSDVLVGVALLVPLIILLFLPTVAPSVLPAFLRDVRSGGGSSGQESGGRPPAESVPIGYAATGNVSASSTENAGYTPSTADTDASSGGRFCLACGKPLRPGARFCGVCGARQSETTS